MSGNALATSERVGIIALCNDLAAQGCLPSTVEHVREVLTARVSAVNGMAARVRELESKLTADGERAREDAVGAARWRYVLGHGGWERRIETVGYTEDGTPIDEEWTFLVVRVPNGSDLSCRPMVERAIDAARTPDGGTQS